MKKKFLASAFLFTLFLLASFSLISAQESNAIKIKQGKCMLLKVSASNIKNIEANFKIPPVKIVNNTGYVKKIICPKQTTTYKVFATGKDGSKIEKNLTIEVAPKKEGVPEQPTVSTQPTNVTVPSTTPTVTPSAAQPSANETAQPYSGTYTITYNATGIQPATEQIQKKAPVYGSLDIASSPGDAAIFINGKYRGNTPNSGYASIDLETGTYEILIKKDSLNYTTTIKIEAGQTYTLNPALS